MSAILFGSISTVADTSELQRRSFNEAFDVHGLGWQWDRDHYRAMLGRSGGRGRIADYAQSLGQRIDAEAVHRTKSDIFQKLLATTDLAPRAGVLDTIRTARSTGWKVGFVTTTSPENIAALLAALSPDVRPADFDVIVDVHDVAQPKPDPAAYVFALERLAEAPDDCVAIEDNPDGIQAAVAAGLVCVAFPNENTAESDVDGAERRIDRVNLDELQDLAVSR